MNPDFSSKLTFTFWSYMFISLTPQLDVVLKSAALQRLKG
jgi:hypothetical protein